MHKGTTYLLGLCLPLAAATVASPAPGGPRPVTASLVASRSAVTPGQAILVGLRLQMEPGWHTYWRNPGDSGLPTRVSWELPPGFSAGEIRWPRPIRFKTGPLVSYGYEHDVLLPVELTVPAPLSSGEVQLTARVSWLECQEVCRPGKADLALTLPVRASAPPGPLTPLFEETARQLPVADPGWTFSASARADAIELTVAPPEGTTLGEAYLYPVTPRLLDHSEPQTLRSSGSRSLLVLPLDGKGDPGERLEGVLVGRTAGGPVALAVDVKLLR